MRMQDASRRDLLDRVLSDEAGQGMTEYASMLVAVAILAIVVLGIIGTELPALLAPVVSAL